MSNNTQFIVLNYLLTPKDHHKHKKCHLGKLWEAIKIGQSKIDQSGQNNALIWSCSQSLNKHHPWMILEAKPAHTITR